MKKTILVIFYLWLSCFFFSQPVLSQDRPAVNPSPTPYYLDYNLPFPGILPDHPLYPMKEIRDKILLNFTRDPVKKYHLNLLFADKHLIMGQLLVEKGNIPLAQKTFIKGEKYLLATIVQLQKLKAGNILPEGEVDKFKMACDKHEQVIYNLMIASQSNLEKLKLNELLGIIHQARLQAISLN